VGRAPAAVANRHLTSTWTERALALSVFGRCAVSIRRRRRGLAMIGYLRGRLLDKRPPTMLLEVHGIGYELDAPMTTFYELPAAGGDSTV